MEKEKKGLNNKGFSLVELIIVIAIMAILAGVLAPQLIKYIDKSRKSSDVQTAQTIATAVGSALANEEAFADKASCLISACVSTGDDFQKEVRSIIGTVTPVPKFNTSTYKDFYIYFSGDTFTIYACGSTTPKVLVPEDELYPNIGDNFK